MSNEILASDAGVTDVRINDQVTEFESLWSIGLILDDDRLDAQELRTILEIVCANKFAGVASVSIYAYSSSTSPNNGNIPEELDIRPAANELGFRVDSSGAHFWVNSIDYVLHYGDLNATLIDALENTDSGISDVQAYPANGWTFDTLDSDELETILPTITEKIPDSVETISISALPSRISLYGEGPSGYWKPEDRLDFKDAANALGIPYRVLYERDSRLIFDVSTLKESLGK